MRRAPQRWEVQASPPDAGLWRVAAASVRGVSHERAGQVCQDAHAWMTAPEGLLVAVVADGAGSAALSHLGAALAVQTALERLGSPANAVAAPSVEKEQGLRPAAANNPVGLPPTGEAEFWKALLLWVLQAVRARIEAEAQEQGVETQALATTLIVAVVTPELTAIAQVGDGAVVAEADGALFALTTPQTGEYVNTTTFLTSPDALEMAQIVVHPGAIARLAVFTDGLQRVALRLPEASPYAPFFAPLFRFVAEEADPHEAQAQLTAFLQSPRVTERTDDDITLVLAARIGP